MAEIKITCPNCLNSKQCFEEKVDIENSVLLFVLIVDL